MKPALDTTAIGHRFEPVEHSWSGEDSILYALSVGAGAEDPETELRFTTENSAGIAQRTLPTQPVIFPSGRDLRIAALPVGAAVHAEQSLTVHAPVPAAGSATSRCGIVAIEDKRSGALVRTETEIEDSGGRLLAKLEAGIFLRGVGGAPTAAPAAPWAPPAGDPDELVTCHPAANQALLYRLNRDRNPIHSDPAVARRSGFPGPILHGLCTYGYAGRALLRTVAGGDPDRFGSIAARFTHPIPVGVPFDVAIWRLPGGARFQVWVGEERRVVLDRGEFTLR